MENPCPCSSGLEYSACCEPLIEGQRPAATAGELMRSRYTAYATGKIDFLKNSTHPDKMGEFDEKSSVSWSQKSQWHGLSIESQEKGGPDDDTGLVEFVATYSQKGNRVRHHEMAEFRKKDGAWYFYDGNPVPVETIRREGPKIGRNDPCPCGSGKKYKRCCG